MSKGISRMLEILGRQKGFQQSLLELSTQKIAAITSGDAAGLQQITDKEKETIAAIGAVDAEQQTCIAELAREFAVPTEDICMSFLQEKAAPAERAALGAMQRELGALVEQQMKYNDINMRLLQMNMEYVQFIINSSTNRQVMPTYGGNGSISHSEPGASLLDRKV